MKMEEASPKEIDSDERLMSGVFDPFKIIKNVQAYSSKAVLPAEDAYASQLL